MKKIVRLLRVQLWAVLGDVLSIGNNTKKKPKLIYIGVLFFTLLMSAVSFFYCMMLGSGLKMFDSLEILPSMMLAVSCVIILMTTIFKVKGTIFGFRDYDMVMSLPVSTGAIVACRLIILYSFNFLFVFIVNVPMAIAYGILAEPRVTFYVMFLILLLFIPLLPIVIASVVGTVIAYLASKFRRTNFLNIIFSMSILLVVMGLSFTVRGNGQELVNLGKTITEEVNSLYPLASMYQKAVVSYDFIAFLQYIGISLFSFVVYTLVVKRIFKRMNTLMMTGGYRVNYRMGELKTASPLMALYKKELKRYFSSSLYVLNTGFGIVILTFAAVASIFVDLDIIFGDPQVIGLFSNNIPLLITFCVVMTYTAASSLSLEGKSLWILKSLPVDPKTIYLAKIGVNLTIIAPAFLDVILLGVVLKLSFLQIVITLLVTLACGFFTSFLGLLVNIWLPNFNWSSEVIIIKQSAASMVSVFTAIGFAGLQFLFLLLFPTFVWGNLFFFLFAAVLDIILYITIMTYGRKRFYSF